MARIEWTLLNASGREYWESQIGAVEQAKDGTFAAFLATRDGEKAIGKGYKNAATAKASVKRLWDKEPPL